MSDPKLGNRSEEIGQFDRGVDFEKINSSGLPQAGDLDPLDVDISREGGDLVVVPRRPRPDENKRGVEVAESETTAIIQMLSEDPQQSTFVVPKVGPVSASPNRLQKALTRHQNRESLIWYGVRAKMQMAVTGDRVIVRHDTMESEYSCRECKGHGYLDAQCDKCRGLQKVDGDIDCPQCKVLGFGRDSKWSSGHVPCNPCRGTGWRAGIIIPEVAQSKPCTGVVVSLGPDTSLLKLGDRVLHSKYSGHTITTPEGEQFTTLREAEILDLIREF